MNDRFRFRVWYNPQPTYGDYPKMLYDAENTYDYMGASELIPADCFGEILEDKNFIVMQCTGLKDKNGKLIYEGDIVTGKDHFDRDRKCVVRYSETYCCYFIVGDRWSDEFMFHISEKEVIGNIYENKELLEVEQ